MIRDILPELNGKEYIKNLSKDYDIRFCNIKEGKELINFIDLNWRKNHIFLLSKELFDWQHLDIENNRYNFVIAKHRDSNEIHSALGFVPTSQFDSEIKETEVWPCIWKVREDIHVKGLGISLYYYLKENLSIETIAILGISEIALSIYKSWGFETGKVAQYYLLNDRKMHYELLSYYGTKCYSVVENDTNTALQSLSMEDFVSNSKGIQMPKYKSVKYYINRFYKHPIYHYNTYGIVRDGICVGVIFTRDCEYKGAIAVRIVDFVGNKTAIEGAKTSLMSLLYEKDAEYMDFVVAGWEEKEVTCAGFLKKDADSIVIPNYFEPFEKRNIELDYAFKTVDKNAPKIFYKADADQDRPNSL